MNKHIPLKWTDEEIKYFSKPIPRIEKASWLTKWLDDYFIWFVMSLMAGATIWMVIKICQLSLLHLWLKAM